MNKDKIEEMREALKSLDNKTAELKGEIWALKQHLRDLEDENDA